MRAKFKVDLVTLTEHAEVLELSAVPGSFDADGNSEDNTFAKWTPTGSLKMTVTNPALHGQIKPGQKFHLDFTLAE